jgi:hypothetical protein
VSRSNQREPIQDARESKPRVLRALGHVLGGLSSLGSEFDGYPDHLDYYRFTGDSGRAITMIKAIKMFVNLGAGGRAIPK